MEILLWPHPQLSVVAKAVKRQQDVDFVVDDMLRFIDKRVLGLAANQIGHDAQVAVINFSRSLHIMINPRVVAQSVEMVMDSESCLSLPGKRVLTLRPKMIHVQFENRDREVETLIAEGYHAKCILHEIDHLNGVMMTERAA